MHITFTRTHVACARTQSLKLTHKTGQTNQHLGQPRCFPTQSILRRSRVMLGIQRRSRCPLSSTTRILMCAYMSTGRKGCIIRASSALSQRVHVRRQAYREGARTDVDRYEHRLPARVRQSSRRRHRRRVLASDSKPARYSCKSAHIHMILKTYQTNLLHFVSHRRYVQTCS